MKTVKAIVIVAISIVIIGSICGCSNLKKEKKVDTHFTAGTEVMYSAGDDSNWAYGNQRKEFPLGEACYVRIGSTVIAEKKKGRNTDITVTYTFTGTDQCSVEISDGIAEEVQSKDTNVKIYSRKLSAKDAKKAKESLTIFRYDPGENAEKINVHVTYDNHVPSQYDVSNTIYFSEE